MINVYPEWERLLELAAGHAHRLLGLVYPRDTGMTKLVVFAMCLMLRVTREPVRAYIRPQDAIEQIARNKGLAPHISRDIGPAWKVALFRRT